jgi:hypothetical protein
MKDVQFRHKSSVGVCGGARGDIILNKCIYEKKIKSSYYGVDMVGPMLARRMIFDGEMCSRLANVWI